MSGVKRVYYLRADWLIYSPQLEQLVQEVPIDFPYLALPSFLICVLSCIAKIVSASLSPTMLSRSYVP